MLHAPARARSRSLALSARRELTISYPVAVTGIAAVAVLAAAASYRTLLPLADSESPDAMLVAVPVVALLLLVLRLGGLSRHGHEVAINLVFAAPLLFFFVALLLWLPPRYANVYWVYRLDMLALPLLTATGVLLLFGLPALLRSWRVFALFAVGWLPVFDGLVGLVADPLARLDALLVRGVASVLAPHVAWTGNAFSVGGGSGRIAISSACAGLAAVFSMALVGAFLGLAVEGTRRAKLLWLGCGLVLVVAANVVRLTAVVVVADRSGMGAAFSVFHASAGVVLFSGSLLVMLLLLRAFHLRIALPRLQEARPLRFPLGGLGLIAALLVSLGAVGAWAESGFSFYGPGSFAGTPQVAAGNVLPAVAGLRREQVERLPFIDVLFGRGARSYQYDFDIDGTTGIGAQIVVVPSLGQVSSYGALDCFVFHRYRVYAAHRKPLKNGGTAWLAALRISGEDVSTISWYQPVRVDGKHAWRRVILFQYLTGKPVHDDFKPSLSRRVGYWLLNTLAPFGDSSPPQRFQKTEQELLAYANAFAVRSVA